MDDVVKTLRERVARNGVTPSGNRPSREEAEAAVRVLLRYIGDDAGREGLLETPRRVIAAMDEFYAGYKQDPAEVLTRVFEDVHGYDDMILVRDIPFVSHCEHHMVPFTGRAQIAYYPQRGRRGRSVEAGASRRHLRQAAADAGGDDRAGFDRAGAEPPSRGCAVMIEAEHMCMAIRGIRKHGTSTVTTRFAGCFKDEPAEQVRFLSLVRHGRP